MNPQPSAECRIGTSGYQYDHWQPLFYPDGLPRDGWFEFYAARFNTVEINNTFYRLPEAETVERWHDRTPNGFRYALKFSRYGTHMKKLKDPADSIASFLDRAERLKSFLGPILVQLPPHWRVNAGRLAAFFDQAPRRHRWAVEFREADWLCEDVYEVLRARNTALCIHDLLADHPRMLTADWTYLRFHGQRYAGGYSHPVLSAWSRWIRARRVEGIDVYAYFNNDIDGRAVADALTLREYVAADD